jgi:S1-C subfamily serine protease
MALVPFVSAQTLNRDLRYDVFRALGAGSEIGVSVRELSNDEVSKAGLELPAPRTARARLGITATPLTNQLAEYFGVKNGGVLVSAVEERSPSATAGLKAGDVIIEIDGAPVRTPQDVAAAARRAAPGTVLDFRVLRDRKETTLREAPFRRRRASTERS